MVQQVVAAKVPFSKISLQVLATLSANVIALGQGCNVGWASPSIPILRSADSPMSTGPLSVDEAAWVVSALPLAAMVGTLSFGTLTNFIGSKRSLLLCVVPTIICWTLTLFGTEPWHLYLARFFSGLAGGGAFLCIPMFVAEIANENVRGRLSSLMQLFFNTGIMLGYVTGSMLDYHTVPIVIMSIQFVFIATFVWLPHSPQYLVKLGKIQEAEASLRFYRNSSDSEADTAALKAELHKFTVIAKQNSEMPPINIKDLCNREALRCLLTGPTLMAIAQFSGTFMMSNYAATIFRATGSTIDPNTSSIILGCIQVLGTICASALIDRLGRKKLLLISCAGSATSLVVTGTYSYLVASGHDMAAWNILPVVSLSAFIFITAVGITPVPYVIMSEVLPSKIRRIGATISVCSVSLFALVMLRMFPILLDAWGLYVCMWACGSVSAVGFFYTLFVVRETKGLNLDQILEQKRLSRLSMCQSP